MSIVGISKDALTLLKSYDWPGNARELKHIIERACFIVGAGVLEREQFSEVEDKILAKATDTEIFGDAGEGILEFDSLSEAREYAEATEIKKALMKAKGNKSTAAKMLKVDRSVLYEKIRKYNLT